MELIEKALLIAVNSHIGQKDKGGTPYILHPLRVSHRFEGTYEKIVAILHDVVEDTDYTLERLRMNGFPEEIINAVDAITRREDEKYFDYIKRVKMNKLAKSVKKQDLKENMDLSRIAAPTSGDYTRLNRYEKALKLLCE